MEVKDSKGIMTVWNGVSFKFNDLVDVFVGTGKGVTGNKAFPIKGRFKGVRVEKGEELFCVVRLWVARKAGVRLFYVSLA
jgi:hypothetical protein